jgi:predicted dehydrogenase
MMELAHLNDTKIKVAIVGTGRISTLNALGYLNNPDAEIYATCDRNKGKAEKMAREWGVKVVYTSYEELLKDKNIDLVEILTPHKTHAALTIAACEAGKHVSLQKPPTLRLSDMDAMIRSAKKNKVKFKVFENFRFHPPYVRAMELIKAGVIGDVYVVNYRMWNSIWALSSWKVPIMTWKWRIEEANNYRMPMIFDDGFHKHSCIRMFLGQSVKKVQAWVGGYRVFKVIKTDMPAVILYKTKSSAKYGVWNTSVGPKLPIRSDYYSCDEFVEIQGSKGIIYINGCTGNMFMGCECGGPGKPGLYWIDSKGEWHSDCNMETNWKWSFINSTKHFIQAIKNDTEPILSGEEAREILQITLAIIKSVRSNSMDVQVNSIVDGIDNLAAVPPEEIEIEEDSSEVDENE